MQLAQKDMESKFNMQKEKTLFFPLRKRGTEGDLVAAEGRLKKCLLKITVNRYDA